MLHWVPVTQLSVGQGRTDAILLPFLLSSTHIAIKVQDLKGRRWQKAGDLWQQFTGGVKGINIFVPYKQQLAVEMDTALGDYYLRFQPVYYHQGLFVEVWKWAQVVTSYSYFGDVIPTSGWNGGFELGTPLTFLANGNITKLRFYKSEFESGDHTLKIWSVNGDLLVALPVPSSVIGWNEVDLESPFLISNGDQYIVSVEANNAFLYSSGANPVGNNPSNPIQMNSNGIYATLDSFPDSGGGDGDYYFVDVVFEPS